MYAREMKFYAHTKLHMSNFSTIINNDKKLEAAQMPISLWMGKPNVWYSCKETLSNKKKWSVDKDGNMGWTSEPLF